MEQGIIEEYQNLVFHVANTFNNYKNKEDLYQVGFMALIKAKRNYKDNLDTKFSTYAYFYILGEMKKYVREDKPLKISRDITKLNLKIEKANILLAQKLGRFPSTSELASFLEIPDELVNNAINANNPIISMDVSYTDDRETTLYEAIPDYQSDLDMNIMLKDAIDTLSLSEREIILKRYMEDLTQSEIARELGMSQVQVSRSENKILKKLKVKLHN